MADANLTGTLLNVLSTVVAGIVLGVLGVIYKIVTGLFDRVETLEDKIDCIAEHLAVRDNFKFPARIRSKDSAADGSD